MMCHGFISAHILDDSDGLSRNRAGLLSVASRNTDAQKKWAARQILGLMKSGFTQTQADAVLGTRISDLIKSRKFPLALTRSGSARCSMKTERFGTPIAKSA